MYKREKVYPRKEKIPVDATLMVIEFMSAAVGALILGGILLLITAIMGGNWANEFQFGWLRGYEATGIIGWFIGIVVGSTIGAYGVNRKTHHIGSWQQTAAGAIAGILPAFIYFFNSFNGTWVLLLCILSPLGATIGCNLNRTPEEVLQRKRERTQK